MQTVEKENPDKMIALDAIAGMLYWKTGQTNEAAELWRKVILSHEASNADKMLAHAGMGMYYSGKGDFDTVRSIVKELGILSFGYYANPWMVEALNGFLETLVQNKKFDCAYEIYGIAIKACKALETESDVSDANIRYEAIRFRADIGFTYAVNALVVLNKNIQAENELQHNVIPLYMIIGRNLRVADCLGQLASICRQQGRLDEALVMEEKGAEMRLGSRYN